MFRCASFRPLWSPSSSSTCIWLRYLSAKPQPSKREKADRAASAGPPAVSLSLHNIPERPKRPLNGYVLFVKEKLAQRKANNESSHVKDSSKECSQLWKQLSEEERASYTKKLTSEWSRYEQQMKEYNQVMSAKVTFKQVVKMVSKFLKEAEDERKTLKRSSPMGLFLAEFSAQNRGTTMADAVRKWSTLDDHAKEKYRQEAKLINDNFKSSLATWKKKYTI